MTCRLLSNFKLLPYAYYTNVRFQIPNYLSTYTSCPDMRFILSGVDGTPSTAYKLLHWLLLAFVYRFRQKLVRLKQFVLFSIYNQVWCEEGTLQAYFSRRNIHKPATNYISILLFVEIFGQQLVGRYLRTFIQVFTKYFWVESPNVICKC